MAPAPAKLSQRLKLLAPILLPQLRELLASDDPAALARELAPQLAPHLGRDTHAAGRFLSALGAELLQSPALELDR